MPSIYQVLLILVAASHLATAAPSPSSRTTTGMGGVSPGGSVTNSGGLQKGGGLFGLEVLNVASNNAGTGGDSRSGSSVSISKAGSSGPGDDRVNGRNNPTTSTGKSGNGGYAGGGSVMGMGGLINIFSGNAGDGGNASSGDVKNNVGAVGNRAFSKSFQMLRSSKIRVAARGRALRSRLFRLDY